VFAEGRKGRQRGFCIELPVWGDALHEYTVIGHPRQKVIFIVAIVSIFASHFITNIIHSWLSFSLSAFTLFTILYFLFNQYIWKFSLFEKVFRFPNIAGEWECTGLATNITSNQDFDWEGTTTITQTWDKVLISLRTKTSPQSLSLTGGIRHFPGVGYKVTYHYENTPSASAVEVKKHEGFCILTFSSDLSTAEGCYFNNIKDRASYGEMKLKRRSNNG